MGTVGIMMGTVGIGMRIKLVVFVES